MDKTRCNLIQGDQGEHSFMQAWVRDRQLASKDKFFTIEEDIEINGTPGIAILPRTPTTFEMPDAAEQGFNFLQVFKKRFWGKPGIDFDDLVKKWAWIFKPPWFSFINSRFFFDCPNIFPNHPQCVGKEIKSIAPVTAQ